MTYLIRFDDERALDPGLVGRKFASLAKAVRLGFEVPPAAAISTEAHRYFLFQRSWPAGLAAEVIAAAEVLELSRGLSIRSSAVREDLENQSFAGQYRSFLRVENADDLREKIEMCWLSAETENVRSYLKAADPKEDTADILPMGVVMQRMVDAAAAGVAFGRNPLNPARDEIVIEGIRGSGESLVNGHVSPHRAYYRRRRPPADRAAGGGRTRSAAQRLAAGRVRLAAGGGFAAAPRAAHRRKSAGHRVGHRR